MQLYLVSNAHFKWYYKEPNSSKIVLVIQETPTNNVLAFGETINGITGLS